MFYFAHLPWQLSFCVACVVYSIVINSNFEWDFLPLHIRLLATPDLTRRAVDHIRHCFEKIMA